MGLRIRILTMFVLLVWCLYCSGVESLSSGPEMSPARALDAILQDYAYRAFVRPQTGVAFNGSVPLNLTGIRISSMRLRSGSLFTRGVPMYREFRIPVGVIEQPYAERLVLVYQNLGNWSMAFYPLLGYVYLAPVLGLLAYDASDLSAKNLPELDIRASGQPISIEFGHVRSVPDGSVARCVRLDLNGQVNFSNVMSGNRCLTFQQGHFSIVVKSTAPSVAVIPRRAPSGSWAWVVVVATVGGFALLVVLVLLIFCAFRHKKRKNMHEMETAAEVGEALHMTKAGSTKAPAAMGTRTQPTLENDYAP